MSCLLPGLAVFAFCLFVLFVFSRIGNNKKEEKTRFYCEVEQWGKCREQCERCKKL